MTAPRASFIRLATGSVVEPSTTCTVTGIERIAFRFGTAFGSGEAGAEPGGSEAFGGIGECFVFHHLAFFRVCAETGRRCLTHGRLQARRDCAVDFETVSPVALAEFADEHPASGAFEPDRVEAAQRQNRPGSKTGDIVEAHRALFQNCRHRQPGLFEPGLHRPRPAAVEGRGLGRLFPFELLAQGEQKRLGQEDKALARPALQRQRKARGGCRHVPPSERETVVQRHEAVEGERKPRKRREGRLERSAERAREFLDELSLDRRAGRRFRPRIALDALSRAFAEDRRNDQIVDPLIESEEKAGLRFVAGVNRCAEAGAIADRLNERGSMDLLDRRHAPHVAYERHETSRRLGDESSERLGEARHALDREARMFENRALELLRCNVEVVRLADGAHAASRTTCSAAAAPPEIVSLSTTSMVGRSWAGIVLRPNSTATCGIAPFMKASRLCLTRVNSLSCFCRTALIFWAIGATTA